MRKLVLAKSIMEANRFARHFGFERGTYRAVRDAGAIRGVRNAEVYLLSSFLVRRDRHRVMAALRGARRLEVYYVDLADFPEVIGIADPRGPLTERQLEVAYRYHGLREAALSTATTIHVVAVPDVTEQPQSHTNLVERMLPQKAADAEALEEIVPERPRRRKRCTCGELVDDVEAHKATHAEPDFRF